jgi:glycosyltransferase involved in cell wall biosynthesis
MASTNIGRAESARKKVRVAYLVTHPIQYQAPLLRRISQEPDIELTVFFGSDFSVREYPDKGFGVNVSWEVSLVEGYRHEFLPVVWDKRRTGPIGQLNYGLFTRLYGGKEGAAFDVLWVHGYSTLNALQGMLVAKALNIPVVLRAESRLSATENTGLKSAIKRLFFNVLRPFVDAVLPIGRLNAIYWRYYLGDSVPQFPMPYAVDNHYFRSRCIKAAAVRSEFLQELNLDASRPVILFASKLQKRKRCGDLLEAYLTLVLTMETNTLPYLVIVGDGEERAALEERAVKSGCSSIRFCGFRRQSELPKFFDVATVFVLPSRDEPWGLIVNEVMNSGRAVIVSDDVGCQADLVEDGVEGYIFPVGNIAALTEALQKVLATPETAVTMGQRGLARIKAWDFESDVKGLRQAIAQVTRKLTA